MKTTPPPQGQRIQANMAWMVNEKATRPLSLRGWLRESRGLALTLTGTLTGTLTLTLTNMAWMVNEKATRPLSLRGWLRESRGLTLTLT